MSRIKFPAVSVITPSYNRLKFLPDTVNSVLTQDFENIEYLIVDDGSDDGSWEWLQSLTDSRVKVFSHPGRQNRGQSASINLGLGNAKGKYIAILDSDDLFSENKLTDQVSFLESNQDIGMVYGQGYAVDENGKFLFKVPRDGHVEPSDPNRLLLDCYMALPGGSLVRRSVFEKVGGFEEGYRASQDHDMALRIMESARCAYLPNLAFYYRKHEGSISKQSLERRWLTGLDILHRAQKRFPYKRSSVRKRKAVLQFRLGQTYWRDRRILKSLPYFFFSGALDPVRAMRVLVGREKV